MHTLTRRSLNRATLERQLLLRRSDLPALDVVHHLMGLQAQDPDPPYIGLWSRIEGFGLGHLTELLHRRAVVRATLLRGTQHLVTAEDYLWLRPLLQPMLTRWQKAAFGRATHGVDPADLAAAAHTLLLQPPAEPSAQSVTQSVAESATRAVAWPLTRSELGRALAERWPGRDPVALARSVQGLLPVLHPPPDGTWGRRGATPFALADQWLGKPLASQPRPQDLVLRYLAAFGPATVKDVQAWSGMTRLREVVEALRPQLEVFRGEDGAELFDLPDAPRPGPDVPAPARLLAALDNVVLGHADRTRLMTDEQRPHLIVHAALTVDGFVHGLWAIKRDNKGTARLEIRLFGPLSGEQEAEVCQEGERLLRLAAADADPHDIRLLPFR